MSQTDNVRFGTFCKAVGYWLLAISLLLAANREIRTPTSILPFVHICRQKVVVGVHREKNPTKDSTKTYSLSWILRDVQLMLPFHGKDIQPLPRLLLAEEITA